VLSGWVSSGEPLIASFLAACGYDEVLVDLQHGAVEIGDLQDVFAAIEARGVAATVRVPTNDPTTIGRVLDLGALSVMVPLVETREEAARAVAACKFPPHGRRSYGPLRAMTTMATESPNELNNVAIIVQVETALGLKNVDEIATTPGLTGIFIGPADLAISMGLDWDDPSTEAARAASQQAVLDACRRANIVPGIITPNGTIAAQRIRQGFRLIGVTSDISLIADGGAEQLRTARAALAPS
jgi:4-hydroxy-2-oxoheptanedioate aldolase